MKDVDLARAAAADRGATLPSAEVVRASMAVAIDAGCRTATGRCWRVSRAGVPA